MRCTKTEGQNIDDYIFKCPQKRQTEKNGRLSQTRNSKSGHKKAMEEIERYENVRKITSDKIYKDN